ncbi:MAG: isopentenyl phosphate kinase family protein [Anaerolineae bacterium]|nr:isopentenyl phosphate kinase family protein [Anaerolineae bacterium]
MPLVFLKLGGSLITDKRGVAAVRQAALDNAAREIRAALDADPTLRLVVGHGSGSFGHVAARKSQMLDGPVNWRAYAEVGAAAARLNRLVTDALLAVAVPAVTVQPSASAVARDGRLVDMALTPLQTLLDAGAVPLIYGDVAVDTARGYCIISTETIFTYLAHALRPDRIVLAGQVDGVYSADPLVHPDAHPVPRLTPDDWTAIAGGLHGAAGVDVTGGMAAKVRAMFDLVHAQPTLSVRLVSGLRPDAIRDAVLGREAGGSEITTKDEGPRTEG